jgi:hypothetical protein
MSILTTFTLLDMYYQNNVTATPLMCETSSDVGDPYYPVPNQENQALFGRYQALAKAEEKANNVHFVGRLANYKYFDMDDAIHNALEQFKDTFGLDHAKVLKQEYAKAAERIASHRGYRVNVVLDFSSGSLDWLNSLCGPVQEVVKDLHFIIYNKQSDVSEEAVTASIRCPSARVTVVSLPAMGGPAHTWLAYMFGAEYEFAHANVFLRNEEQNAQHAIVAIKLMYTQLYSKQAILASSQHMRQRNIHNFAKRCPIVSPSKQASLTITQLETPQPELHYLPFGDVVAGWPKGSESGYQQDYCDFFQRLVPYVGGGECQLAFKSLGNQFALSDAGLRRALARHRTVLHALYTTMVQSKLAIASEYLEQLWLTVFLGSVTSTACPEL